MLAVEAAGDGHADWIVATDEFYASPRLLEMCGLPADATFSGRADFIARFPYHPEDRDRVLAAIKAHYAGRSTRMEIDMRIVRRGETRWMHATLLCSRDASGALLRASTAFTDITERTRLERQLGQAQRLEAMGTLAGGIAHDFNNILGAILGYGEMALRGARQGKPAAARPRQHHDRGRTRARAGRADPRLQPQRRWANELQCTWSEWSVKRWTSLRPTCPRTRTIVPRLRAGQAAVLGDPTQVHQVLMNLATNAIQAMASGGTLRVSLEGMRLDAPRVATVGTLDVGNYVVLEVGDSGSASPLTTWAGSSIRSSPPKRSALAPGSDCHSCTVSSPS